MILALIIITANDLQYMFATNKFYQNKFDFNEVFVSKGCSLWCFYCEFLS